MMKLGKLLQVADRLKEIDGRLAFQAQAVLGSVLDDLLLEGVQAEAVSSAITTGPLLVETPRGCRMWIGFRQEELLILGLNPRVRPIVPTTTFGGENDRMEE
jgi:hypothetical protein